MSPRPLALVFLWLFSTSLGNTASAVGGLSEGVLIRLARTPWIASGKLEATQVVYVFIDTECPYCHELMLKLDRVEPAVQVRYVLVAVLREVSLPHAAAILASPDPPRSLHALVEGKTPARGPISPAARESIATNNLLMEALNLAATPGLVYRDSHGSVRAVAGVPDDAAFDEIFRPVKPPASPSPR